MRNNKNILTLRFKNIISSYRIIKLNSLILIFSLLNITLCSSNIFNNSNTSALDYSSNVDIGFTFNPKLNITLSNPNLIINNLVPGSNAVDSNTITINVSTNITEGYNLFATAGGNNNTNNGYNTTNLVNAVDNNYIFASLPSNVSELSNFTNNTWGYSYCVSNCSSASTPDTPNPNWISGDYNNASTGYNGLPLYTDTGIKLVEKADSTNSTVNFKIAAKAGNTQPSGEYTNVINFTVVSNTIPTTMLDAFIASGAKMHNGYFKMQDMTPTICKSIDTDGEKGMQLIDVRDDKVYWVAKLKDGNCWMTQNLDLDLSHEVALTSETSDIDPTTYNTGIYTQANGYSKDKDTGVVAWLPERSTYTSTSAPGAANWAGDTGNNATSGYYRPYSWNRIDNNGSPVYPDSIVTKAIAGDHAQSGNYYNWSATMASNNSLGVSGGQMNSVCPKRWKIPTNNEYTSLYYTYKTENHNYNAFGLMSAPLWFIRSGYINRSGSLDSSNSYGVFWSSLVEGGGLAFYYNQVYPYDHQDKIRGDSIRCLAR